MNQISVKSLEKALKKIDQLDENSLDKLIETFTLKQQILVDYILQAGLEFQKEELNVYSIYYFAVIYEAFHQEGVSLSEISESDIDDFREPFILALDAIHTKEDYAPMHDLIQQPNIQQFLVDEIESPDSEGIELDDETKTQLFIVTMSMLGIMNASIQPSA